MRTAQPSWRKSSFSGPPDSDCVEVALTSESAAVHDSKNTSGPALAFPANTWRTFLTRACDHD
ncbi:MAG TPA: DUF397 domain-containing protein [Pseudonocardiaceae bacterium]|jgi:hypothetical protein|nr:DUF397 domain-containing protein [Pseudonocardiaceae bacterium]